MAAHSVLMMSPVTQCRGNSLNWTKSTVFVARSDNSVRALNVCVAPHGTNDKIYRHHHLKIEPVEDSKIPNFDGSFLGSYTCTTETVSGINRDHELQVSADELQKIFGLATTMAEQKRGEDWEFKCEYVVGENGVLWAAEPEVWHPKRMLDPQKNYPTIETFTYAQLLQASLCNDGEGGEVVGLGFPYRFPTRGDGVAPKDILSENEFCWRYEELLEASRAALLTDIRSVRTNPVLYIVESDPLQREKYRYVPYDKSALPF